MLNISLKNSDWIKKLTKISKGFYSNNKPKITDIIIYGSAIRGKDKPKDIDIIIIFDKIEKNDYFDIPYEFRKTLEKHGLKADVKGIYLKEILDTRFLARSAILYEGFSLIKNDFFGHLLGFENRSIFIYSLKNLTQSQKIRFLYALNGRGVEGILDQLEGRHIGAGIIFIPIKNAEKFKEFLESWNLEFEEWRGILKKTSHNISNHKQTHQQEHKRRGRNR
jgi:predicted nucleotidyltransferase